MGDVRFVRRDVIVPVDLTRWRHLVVVVVLAETETARSSLAVEITAVLVYHRGLWKRSGQFIERVPGQSSAGCEFPAPPARVRPVLRPHLGLERNLWNQKAPFVPRRGGSTTHRGYV